jgi:hypothetical protein
MTPRLASSGRHALAVLPDGGVLLDIQSGGFFELNETGCTIWEGLIRHGSQDQAARELTDLFGISREQAARDVALAVASAATPAHQEGGAPLWFHRADDRHYQIVYRAGPVLSIDLGAETVRGAGAELPQAELAQAFRLVAAKVLSREGFVLHASAVRRGAELRAFAGESGAGKTTTAHAFAAAGCELVSEDLLVVEPAGDEVGVRAGAEPVIRGWAEESARALLARSGAVVSCASLRAVLPPVDGALSRLTFLTAARRSGDRFVEKAMGMAWTAASCLQNGFISVHDPEAWRQRLQKAARLAARVGGHRGTVPDGLGPLDRAVRAYMSNSTS